MHKTLFVGAIVASSLSLLAQQEAGFYFNVATGATTRGAAADRASQQITRYDAEDYVGWGRPVISGGQVTGYEITGMTYVIQDQYDGTLENYWVHLYPEDTTTPNPNFPACTASQAAGTNAYASFGPFTNATTGTNTVSAYIYTTTFATPVVRLPGLDLFCAIELSPSAINPNTNQPWTSDGLSVHISLGTNPNFPPPTTNTFDLKGPGLISGGLTNTSYGMAHDLVNLTQAYGGPRQYRIVPIVGTAAAPVVRGVVTATTNQSSYPLSNAQPGTASFFSGLHPDASASPANPGRADDSGYTMFGAGGGDLLFVLAAFPNALSPVVPLTNLYPGASGVACLDLFSNTTLGFTVANGSGTDSFPIVWPTFGRQFLTGALSYQAIGLNPVTLSLYGFPCGTQRF